MSARSALHLPDDAGGLEERIKQQRRRVERVLAFLEAVEGAARRDPALAGAPLEQAAALYGGTARLKGQELLAALTAIDLEPATEAMRALQAQPVLPSSGTSPLSAPGQRAKTAPLPPSVRPATVRSAPTGAFQRDRAAAGLADRAFLQGRKGFEAAYRLGTELLGYVGPRLTMVQAALGVTGLPGPRRPWEEVLKACPQAAAGAGIGAPMQPWVPKLAQLFHSQVDVARRAFVAVNHWTTAKELHGEAQRVAGGLDGPTGEAALRQFPTGRYYGALFPLGNLHLHFQGVPHMGKLFPPREPAAGRAFSG